MATSTYQFFWIRSFHLFSGWVALATLLGLGASLVVGCAGLLLLLRQQDQLDLPGSVRSALVKGLAKASLIGAACGIASAAFWLIAASILATIQQLPPSLKALPLSWLFLLLVGALGFVIGLFDTSALRPRTLTGFWAVMLFGIGLPLLIGLGPGNSEELKLGGVNLATGVGYALLIGYYGEKVTIVVQRHGKACGVFLILSAIVLLGVTLAFQVNPPL